MTDSIEIRASKVADRLRREYNRLEAIEIADRMAADNELGPQGVDLWSRVLHLLDQPALSIPVPFHAAVVAGDICAITRRHRQVHPGEYFTIYHDGRPYSFRVQRVMIDSAERLCEWFHEEEGYSTPLSMWCHLSTRYPAISRDSIMVSHIWEAAP